MSAAWMAVVVTLWVVVVILVLVVAGVLRRVLALLEMYAALPAPMGTSAGPPPGQPLPALQARDGTGRLTDLADLPGPFVLAVLTSHCQPCLEVADALRLQDPERLQHLVVLTDGGGLARVGPPAPARAFEHDSGDLMATLAIPGTPFVTVVDSSGAVRMSQILAGVDHLLHLLRGIDTSASDGAAGAVGRGS